MSLKIKAGFLFEPKWLKVDAKGIKFYEWRAWGGAKKFAFGDVQCILMSNDHTLSFQAGGKIYSIRTKPDKPKHQETISRFVREVERTELARRGLPAGPHQG
jgi:hypothetical protein